MQFLWFLLGLAIGLVLLVWRQTQMRSRLKLLTQTLQVETVGLRSSLEAQMSAAIVYHQDAQQALKHQISVWQRIVDAAPIGYVQVDEENQLVWCNQTARDLFGIEPQSYQPPRLLLELVRSYELDSLIEKTRNRDQPCQREWTFYPASADADNLSQARSRPIRGSAFPLFEGEVGVFLEDRSEAIALSQQRDRWTSDVAHELKTPLTSIRLVAETLQMRVEPPIRDWVDRLINETIRLSMLVQELLDLSQLDLNPSQRLRLKSVDLVKVMYAAWHSLEPLSGEKQLKLSYEGLETAIVRADEARMHRMFLNLFDNSIKYSSPNGTIHVNLIRQPDHPARIQIEVIDQGTGFPQEALPHVFDRFYRADPSRVRLDSYTPTETGATMPLSSGSGLGLAIVRQIVEAHHGFVRAQNHPETGGAWMQIILPVDRHS